MLTFLDEIVGHVCSHQVTPTWLRTDIPKYEVQKRNLFRFCIFFYFKDIICQTGFISKLTQYSNVEFFFWRGGGGGEGITAMLQCVTLLYKQIAL